MSGSATKEEVEEYDLKFVELEFRALRSYLMNYKESARFDKWSRYGELGSWAVGLLGLLGGAALIYHKKNVMGGTVLGFTFPTSGAVQWSARGQSEVFPSLATRAQNHVNAGAEMTRIHRLAKLYRAQLKHRPDPSDLDAKYKELLSAYKAASICTVIREAAYEEYNTVGLVCAEHDRRRDQVDEYCKHEEKRKQLKMKE